MWKRERKKIRGGLGGGGKKGREEFSEPTAKILKKRKEGRGHFSQ